MQRFDFCEQQIEDCEARIAAQVDRLTPPGDSPSGDGGAGGGSAGEGWKTLSRTGGKKSAAGDKALTMALHEMMGVDLKAIPTIGLAPSAPDIAPGSPARTRPSPSPQPRASLPASST